jgi:hypothetical protein
MMHHYEFVNDTSITYINGVQSHDSGGVISFACIVCLNGASRVKAQAPVAMVVAQRTGCVPGAWKPVENCDLV